MPLPQAHGSLSRLTSNGKGLVSGSAGCGLLAGWPAPSREVLLRWLKAHGAVIHPALRIADMEDESGWRVVSDSIIDPYEILYSIPKNALLSARTSSLASLAPSLFPKIISDSNGITNHTILQLALCLLHEFRLGQDSPFHGYLQSLPRDITDFLLPMFWEVPEPGGEDGQEGRRWLRGSEAERRIRAKEKEGLGYADLQSYYTLTSPHLPPTPAHPHPSPFLAFIHCFTLISTRAFVIDLYRPTALVPFADILNHSSTPHTSLASDDFVCHICGSLSRCSHDPTNPAGMPYRLLAAGISDKQREELARPVEGNEDTVEMTAEREVAEGEEVWNSYGEIGDAGLLAEWGFLGGEYAGEGLRWEVEDILEGDKELEDIWGRASGPVQHGARSERVTGSGSNPFSVLSKDNRSRLLESDEDEDDSTLIALPDPSRPNYLALSLSGQISFPLFLLLYLRSRGPGSLAPESSKSSDVDTELIRRIVGEVQRVVEELEKRYAQLDDTAEDGELGDEGIVKDDHLAEDAKAVIASVLRSLEGVMRKMHRTDLDAEQLLKLRDDLPPTSRYTRMALTLTIDERSLITSTIEKWSALQA